MKRVAIFGMLLSLLFSLVLAQGYLPAQARAFEGKAPAGVNPLPPSAPSLADATATPTARPSYERPLINMTSSTYDPSKAYVGGKFVLTTIFKNSGQKTAYNIVLTFTSNDLQSQGNGGVQVIPTLDPDQDATMVQTFLIKSSMSTYQTSVGVALEYKDADGKSYTQTFSSAVSVYWLTLNTSTPTITPSPTATPYIRPQVVVTSYLTDVEALRPGATFNLVLRLENLGVFAARNVSVTIGSSSSGGTTTTSTNFLPVGSSNVRVIGNLDPKQVMELKQTFVVNSSTSPGVYPVTLDFTYRDPNNTAYSEQQIISLLVYLIPSIDVSFYTEVAAQSVGKKSSLPLQIVNLGSSSVLLGQVDVSAENATLANNSLFVGTLDAGSNFTMDVDFTPLKAGDLPIKIKVSYMDNFKNPQSITKSLTVNASGTAAGTPGATGGTQGTPQPGSTPGAGTSGQTAAATGETWLQVVLRVVRGLIGFDSAPEFNPATLFRTGTQGQGQGQSQTTRTP